MQISIIHQSSSLKSLDLVWFRFVRAVVLDVVMVNITVKIEIIINTEMIIIRDKFKRYTK